MFQKLAVILTFLISLDRGYAQDTTTTAPAPTRVNPDAGCPGVFNAIALTDYVDQVTRQDSPQGEFHHVAHLVPHEMQLKNLDMNTAFDGWYWRHLAFKVLVMEGSPFRQPFLDGYARMVSVAGEGKRARSYYIDAVHRELYVSISKRAVERWRDHLKNGDPIETLEDLVVTRQDVEAAIQFAIDAALNQPSLMD